MPVEPGDRSDTSRTRTVTAHPHRGVRIDRLATGVQGVAPLGQHLPPGPTPPPWANTFPWVDNDMLAIYR
ncbi:Uncharacterised protein [Actinomadura madurae]|nr:Uncharacterised protein [Actinomadura madurae]